MRWPGSTARVNAEDTPVADEFVASPRPPNFARGRLRARRADRRHRSGDDGAAIIWDAATGQPLHHPVGHTDWVRAVAYAPDGTTLATASDDTTAIIWDTATGQPLTTLAGHTGWVNGIAYAPDGTDPRHRQRRHHRHHLGHRHRQPAHHASKGHTDWVRAIAYAPDGQTLATASDDTTAIIWDTTTGQPLTPSSATPTGSGPSPTPPTAKPSPPPATTRTAIIWDTTTGQPVHTLTGHTDWVKGVAYAPDGSTLATASDDTTAIIWDTTTGTRGHPLKATPTGSTTSPTPPTARHLATASDDPTAMIWDAATGQPLTTLDTDPRREPGLHRLARRAACGDGGCRRAGSTTRRNEAPGRELDIRGPPSPRSRSWPAASRSCRATTWAPSGCGGPTRAPNPASCSTATARSPTVAASADGRLIAVATAGSPDVEIIDLDEDAPAGSSPP